MSVVHEHIADIPAYIFGAGSSLCPPLAGVTITSGATPIWIMALSLITAAIYLAWLNYWSGQSGNHIALYKYLGFHRGEYTSKIESLTPSFTSYIISGAGVATLTVWIALITLLSEWTTNLQLCAALLVGIIAITLYQWIVIKLIGAVADAKALSKIVLSIKGICYSITAMWVTPTILCCLLTSGEQKQVFIYIVAAELFAILAIFLYETFLLFLSKKVSLLHTILYLCAVEIFPVTLIWGFFCR